MGTNALFVGRKQGLETRVNVDQKKIREAFPLSFEEFFTLDQKASSSQTLQPANRHSFFAVRHKRIFAREKVGEGRAGPLVASNACVVESRVPWHQ